MKPKCRKQLWFRGSKFQSSSNSKSLTPTNPPPLKGSLCVCTVKEVKVGGAVPFLFLSHTHRHTQIQTNKYPHCSPQLFLSKKRWCTFPLFVARGVPSMWATMGEIVAMYKIAMRELQTHWGSSCCSPCPIVCILSTRRGHFISLEVADTETGHLDSSEPFH